MSEKWVLVPEVASPSQAVDAVNRFGGVGYNQLVAARPPIPDDVFAEMVERAYQAQMHTWTGPMLYEAVVAGLRAALGLDERAAAAVHEKEET